MNIMRLGLKKMVLMAGAVGLGASLQAAAATERYQLIIDRNVFGLTEPPREAPPPQPEPPPLNVTFTGVASFGGVRHALFMIPGSNPSEPARYLSLAEGDRDGALVVEKILEGSGEVQIRNSGNLARLNFNDHGHKPVAVPQQMVAQTTPGRQLTQPGRAGGGQPPQPGVRQGQPGQQPTRAPAGLNRGQPAPQATAASRVVPTRTLRMDTSSGGRSIQVPGMSAAPGTGGGSVPAPPLEPALPPEAQRVIMELQKTDADMRGQAFPPLPPIP